MDNPGTASPSGASRAAPSNGAAGGQTLSTRVSRELVRTIVRGDLAPGQGLPSEDELAARFEVSRPVIREAVKELTVLGLVESRKGRATRVLPATAWNDFAPALLAARSELGAVDGLLLELLELRRLVEVGAAGLAASRASAADLERMTEALAAMDRSTADRDRFTDGDIAFHAALLDATGNQLLTRLIQTLTPLLRFGRAMSLELRPDGPADSQRGHVAILEAVRAGDVEGARSAMREHLSWTANLRVGEEADDGA